jgi:shikimate dehydrogenase
MQNAALRKKKLPAVYLPFHVRPAELSSFVKWARKNKIAGLNVTIPHKESILKFLDAVSPEARAIGAVNTILRKGRKLIGHNTDGIGYLRSLREEVGFSPRGKKILVLGAGGSARALLHSFRKNGARKVYIANRTFQKGAKLAKKFGAVPLHLSDLSKILPEIDLVVNATSVGLKGTRFKAFPFGSLKAKAIVSDLVYRPVLTPFLREAKKRKMRTHSGLGMLLHQGAESFRIWTGKKPDLKAMRKALLAGLE